jgi:hypothetical protein
MKKTLAKISGGVLAVSASVTQAFAQNGIDWIGRIDTVGKPLESWIVDVLNFAIGIAALIAVVMLIAAGYMYITAGGDEGKVGTATKTLTFAFIGLVECFIAVILVQFVLANILK